MQRQHTDNKAFGVTSEAPSTSHSPAIAHRADVSADLEGLDIPAAVVRVNEPAQNKPSSVQIDGLLLIAGVILTVHGLKTDDAWFEGEALTGEILLGVSCATLVLFCCCCTGMLGWAYCAREMAGDSEINMQAIGTRRAELHAFSFLGNPSSTLEGDDVEAQRNSNNFNR